MERHRIVVAVAIAVVPMAGLIGFGCSDDEKPSASMLSVDPGGTFGAEIFVRVVGRGHVTGSIPGSIDCPRGLSTSSASPFPQDTADCYAKYTFASQSDKGAADGITLKAEASDRAHFVGWKFEADQIGTKAKGPDTCSPTKRAASQPGDSNGPEIKLPFGQVAGTAPAGHEGECFGDLLNVPLAYKLVATFEDDPVPPDGGDDGGDGGTGPGTVLFEAPVAGATGGDLYLLNGRLYWRYTTTGGSQGIASGLASAIGPSTPQIVVTPSTTIPKFEGDYNNVLYETSSGTLGVFNSSNPTFPITSFTSVPGTCDAIESYYSPATIYCLYFGTIYSWPATGGSRTTVTSSVPSTSGRPMAATNSYFWIVNDPGTTNGATIQRSTRIETDGGGAATWEQTITGETNPIKLFANSIDYLVWIKFNATSDIGEVHSSTGSSTVYTPVPGEAGLKFVAPDSSSSFLVAGVSPLGGAGGKIYRTSIASSPLSLTPAVTNIPNLTGLAADASYYYWTQNDGRVYRKSKL